MKFIGLVGTNASKSYNRQLLQFMQRHFKTEATIEVREIKDLPLFNEDALSNPPASVLDLNDAIKAADGVILATPEYDHAIPAALKSVIEWLSCVDHPFQNKPIMIVGASLGAQGTSRAQIQLRETLDAPGIGGYVLPGNEFLLSHATTAFDDNGWLKDTKTVAFLEECFAHFSAYTDMINAKFSPKTTSTSQLKWSASYDVIVLGFGAAGASAARFAADNHAKTLLVDAAPNGHEGGNVRYAGQVVATGTDYDQLLAYYRAMLGTTKLDEDLLQTYVHGMVNMRDYFKDYLDVKEPVSYNDTYKYGPKTGPSDALAPEYPELPGAKAFDLTLVHEGFFDAALWKNLRQHVLDRSDQIDVWLDSPAEKLIQDPETKAILGVQIKRHGVSVNIRARNGVVMSMGGFETNNQYIQDYLGAPHLAPIGSLYNRGDGIRMAEEVGADLWHMHSYEGLGILAGMTFAPKPGERGKLILAPWPDLYTGSILVAGDDGSRYFREDEPNRHGRLYDHGTWRIPTAQDHAYLIFDQAQYEQFKAADNPDDSFLDQLVKADTLADLAAATDLQPTILMKTVQDFNQFAENGEDFSQHRAPETMRAFDDGPYYAARLEAGMLNTQGGPRRNAKAEILDVHAQPIPHLYGAGELGGANANQYAGGSNLAECLIFGKIAGENAAQQTPLAATAPVDGPAEATVDLGGNDVVEADALANITVGPNQYLGVSEAGIGGQVVVRITYTDATLQNVEIVQQSESEDVGQAAVEQLPAAMVQANSADVDSISGASASSRAIKSAVKNALSKVKTTVQ
ncbi:NAD(P)H-dependent oxidoreductase [Lactiplantibacillus mudanjiangensis]|uniref:Urocanate reductase n=1 Tax=Lactiplantibacillus mudanjiangensis TaxID=1296538 RepID=A0A660DUD3_9LACO|nr:NAD(P)H-dependent oxidoreductase [Lactiplantibacillus mudanjiangensis]VDG21229.1 FAD-binding dehydrogenase [Lactobacillus coryniformis subsp. coryniformis KCTC 3167 = DSM] [Lactiplantibacillus mudanjiangensis]VDG22823.1 FAD-binding dehydrogenase [Lactobacillus coryniformis subsp. coryniformis KCTC 3167 = DSM] [Lactiplantibacillus mudanjiangensis]VDG26605.1 FAD-binding dehydrogenase [Lactobacillus coryniformis subsp. coryniformis KCTC 3167 = DSM] [Lactiplantibacillus mudanjiangensis]VDG31839.